MPTKYHICKVDKQGEDVVVDGEKFDSLLRKMLKTPPLPKSEIRVAKPKPKKRKNKVAE